MLVTTNADLLCRTFDKTRTDMLCKTHNRSPGDTDKILVRYRFSLLKSHHSLH